MSSKKDYLDYVREVLGVQSLFAMPAVVEPELEVPLIIYVQDYLSYTAAEKNLLQKMLLALKVPLLQMHLLDFNDPKKIKYQIRVCLTDQKPPAGTTDANDIHTLSPRVLLQNTALKKVAWDDLQKVLLFFQSKNESKSST
ncbi:MAG: hypothetical protein H7061_09690 [Bdellovibrionaceae bacterium]|nr:hypothetical protein [Bdellovibrio sp.]